MLDQPQTAPQWPAGDGEMARRIRVHDWARTPLGPVQTWPRTLKTAVDLCLASALPGCVWWGRDLVQFYNDAALAIVRAKHPEAFGAPAREAWSDVWGVIGPLVERVLATGEAARGDDLPVVPDPVVPDRGGPRETATVTVSCGALRDEAGAVAGLFITAVETTAAVQARAELRESEALLRVALDSGRMGTWRWDCRTRRVRGDAAFLALWGVAPSDEPHPIEVFTGRMSPDGAAAMEAVMAKDIAPGEEFDGHLRIAAGPNAGRWVRWRGRAGRERPWVIAGVGFDVTEQKLADERLRESEERRAFLLELSDALRPLADPAAIQGEACRLLAGWLDADRAYYVEVDEAADIARVGRDFVRGDAASIAGEHRVAAFAWSVAVLRRGECHVVGDTRISGLVPPADRPACAALRIIACMGAPLIKGGRLVGALCATASRPRAWTPGEVGLLREVGERTWAAVERARAEAALRESEARLRALVTAGGQPVYRMSPDWRRMYRLEGQALLADTAAPVEDWADAYIPPEDRPAMSAAIEAAIRAGSLFELEHRVRRADGGVAWVLSRAVPIPGPDGTITEWFGVGNDVTERREAVEKLRESEARLRASERWLRTALDATAMGTFDYDPAQGRLALAQASVEVFGLVPGTTLPATGAAFAIVHPDDVERRRADFLGAVRRGGDYRTRYRIVRPRDGRVAWIEERGSTVTDPETGAARVCGVHWDVTERVRAERALRESEERFRALAEAVEDVFYMTDLDRGTLLYLSPSYERVWGRPAAALLADLSGFEAALHPDDRPAFEAAKAAQARGERVAAEYRVVRPDGAVRWVHDRSFPVPGGPGRRAAGVASDVTARKEAEAARRESEARFRRVFSNNMVPMGLWTKGSGIVDANDALLGLLGRTRAELEAGAIRWDEITPPEYRGRDVQAVAELEARGSCTPYEKAFRRKDGRRVPIIIGGGGFDERTGTNILFAVDLTERKRAEAALRESEARFRQFAETSSDLLWIRDAETLCFEYLGPAFEAIYGRGREAVLGGHDARSWAELIHPDDRGLVLDNLGRLRAGERVAEEFRVVPPADGAGAVRWVSNTGFPLPDEAGRVRRIAGIASDVTERKEAAERMGVLVAELQHRTRNLLAVVRAVADKTMAGSASLDDFRARFGARLAALARVNGLLSRLNEGDRVTFDELIRAELSGHGAVDADGHGPQVSLDGPRGVRLRSSTVQTFALALHELATNAVKYGALSRPEGRLRVAWRVVEGKGGERRLRVEWEESGVLVPPSPDGQTRRRGYGRELIERALPYQLKAETRYALGPQGVYCAITLPISAQGAAERAPEATAGEAGHA